MRGRSASLLVQIEEEVMSDQSLAGTLRKCVILGGKSGSKDLREWATRELKGYSGEDDVPEYRTVGAPLYCDAVTGNTQIRRQQIGVSALPEFARDIVEESFTMTHGVGHLEAMIEQSAERGHIDISLPRAAEIGHMMDQASGNPFQHILSIYWSVSTVHLNGIVDRVRTTLAELVAEMRAGLPDDAEVPPAAVADQAVNVAVHGRKARVTVAAAHAAGSSTASAASLAEDSSGWWTRRRVVLAAVGGLASVAGLIFAIAQWQGWL